MRSEGSPVITSRCRGCQVMQRWGAAITGRWSPIRCGTCGWKGWLLIEREDGTGLPGFPRFKMQKTEPGQKWPDP